MYVYYEPRSQCHRVMYVTCAVYMYVWYSLLVLADAHIAHLCQEGDLLDKVFIRNKMAQLIALTFVQDYPMKVLHLHLYMMCVCVLNDIMLMCYASRHMCCAAGFLKETMK